jgi:GNAT superfamily N-acetyltransferase
MDLRARVATDADVASILPMMIEFNAHEEIAFDPASGEPILRELMRRPDLGCVIAFETDRIVGYAIVTYGFDLEFGGRDAFLTELFLVKDVRGQGAGKRALEHVFDFARTNGVHALHLQVRDDNPHAARLYERAGFETPARKLMTKRL